MLIDAPRYHSGELFYLSCFVGLWLFVCLFSLVFVGFLLCPCFFFVGLPPVVLGFWLFLGFGLLLLWLSLALCI